MKTLKYTLLSFLLLTLTLGSLTAQRSYRLDPAKMQFKHLKAEKLNIMPELNGLWMRTWQANSEGLIVLTPKAKDEMRWGNYLDFGSDGAVSKGYSAPCGNDTNIHRHSGHYKVNGSTLILKLGINGTRRFEIVSASENKLILKQIGTKRW